MTTKLGDRPSTAQPASLTAEAARSLRRRLRPLMVAAALLGFMLWVPVEKLFMTDIGFNAASIGVMAAAYSAATPMMEIPSGILADRWSRRGVLIIAAVALALTSLVGGLSFNVPTYIASALILAVYFAMYSGTMDAVVYDTILEEIGASDAFERQIGKVRMVESATLVSSALAGGVVAELTSPRFTYFLTVPFAAAAVLALLRFDEPQLHKQRDAITPRAQLALVWTAIARNPRFLPVIALTVTASLLLSAIFEFGPLWLVAADTAPGLYGPYWASLMAMLGLGGLLAGRAAFHRPMVVTAMAATLLAASLALTIHWLPAAVGAQVALVLLLLMVSIRASQLMHDSVESNIRAGVASGISALGWITFIPFAFFFGWIGRSQGVHVAAWLIVAGTVIVCLTLVAVARRQPPIVSANAEALTSRMLRDVRQCLLERRNYVPTLDCADIVELVTDFLENGLDRDAELQFSRHLEGCPGCSTYLTQIEQTATLLRDLPDSEQLADTTRAALLATFRDSL